MVTEESILRIARQCVDAEKEPYDETCMDAMNALHQFENNLIPQGGQERYNLRVKLIDFIVERKTVSEAGCRHCPHCLNETPTKFSVCLGCWTELESFGIKPYRFQSQDDSNEDETTKKEIDEEVRRQNDSMFEETVNEAKENVEKEDDHGFNPDDVDYGDDEKDDEMAEGEEEEVVVDEEDEDMEATTAEEEAPDVPMWAKNLETGTKNLPMKGMINNDVAEAAAILFDCAIITRILQMYKFYYEQRVEMKPEDYHKAMIDSGFRLDLHNICHYTGEDVNGRLHRPTENELDRIFDEKAKVTKWSQGERLYSGRPRSMLMSIIIMMEAHEKMMEFMVKAGCTPTSLELLAPIANMKGSNKSRSATS